MPTREQVAAWRLCWDDAPQVVAMAEMLDDYSEAMEMVDSQFAPCPWCGVIRPLREHTADCLIGRLLRQWRGEVDDGDTDQATG